MISEKILSRQKDLLIEALNANQNIDHELEETVGYLVESEDNLEKNDKTLSYFRITFPFLVASNLLKKAIKNINQFVNVNQILYIVTESAMMNLKEGRKEAIKILNCIFNNSSEFYIKEIKNISYQTQQNDLFSNSLNIDSICEVLFIEYLFGKCYKYWLRCRVKGINNLFIEF